jgi:hypothetical protein
MIDQRLIPAAALALAAMPAWAAPASVAQGITAALRQRGFSDADLARIGSGI